MKQIRLTVIFLLFLLTTTGRAQVWIRINQAGYLPQSVKVAVLMSKQPVTLSSFDLCDALTDEVVWRSDRITPAGSYGTFPAVYRLDFSDFGKEGAWYIRAGGCRSPSFRIANDVFDGAADFLLNYLREQQCGYNPVLQDSCHTHDGFIIYDPPHDSTFLNVVGGWHDATDYLRYVTTSANTVFQMLFAWQQNPSSFGDRYDASGNPGANGIPDILDEAKWGLDWLVKMNPAPGVMYNQVADDRDHVGFRLPNHDSVRYGPDLQRPVYRCTGKPQGLFGYKNKTTGVASTAGKFASAFSLGARILKSYYPAFAETIAQKAIDAYTYGLQHPGVCQTAPGKAPYYYQEDNWTDDMELAAMQLYLQTRERKYLDDAIRFGKQEPVTPWMGADTALHYQWYPFINLGHYYLAAAGEEAFAGWLGEGLRRVWLRARNDPFQMGVPYIWCSNNLVTALITQCRLYRQLTGDSTYLRMEAAMRDWLLGCNPWGTSMIIGYPQDGISPKDPHSSFVIVGGIDIPGGLVDGPVYTTIFNNLEKLTLTRPDRFREFQTGIAVYHDDHGDYSTNEPTLDGTASLTYYLSALQKAGNDPAKKKSEYVLGGLIRTDTTRKEIHLVFTAHDYGEGLEKVRKVLQKHHIHGAFFFTGDFYRDPAWTRTIRKLKKEGHYLGAHSDKHLLYASWTCRDSTLVSREDFFRDLKANYTAMKRFGIAKDSARYFLPPYEWYNADISRWCTEAGLKLINFTPGTSSNQDWTWPGPGRFYLSSETIFRRILDYEKEDPHGLNGFILLTHPGTDPRRTDKFYDRLDELITILEKKGYTFTTRFE
jgi:peptidoglycan/xylan/chitin deacetylase (PgdA/CDA1 family)